MGKFTQNTCILVGANETGSIFTHLAAGRSFSDLLDWTTAGHALRAYKTQKGGGPGDQKGSEPSRVGRERRGQILRACCPKASLGGIRL